jgi:hypothetical protein
MSKGTKSCGSCEICGETPAYWSKLTGRTLCRRHQIEAIIKILMAGGAIVTLIHFFL